MSKSSQRILFLVAVIVGYVGLSSLGEFGAMLHDALGSFALGWVAWDLATFIIRDEK